MCTNALPLSKVWKNLNFTGVNEEYQQLHSKRQSDKHAQEIEAAVYQALKIGLSCEQIIEHLKFVGFDTTEMEQQVLKQPK